MIAAWMLWSIGVGLLLLVAGLAAEKVFEGRRRWVWAGAGVATVLLMIVRVLTSGGAEPGMVAGAPVIPEVAALGATIVGGVGEADAGAGTLASSPSTALLPLTVPHDSSLHTLDGILLLVWLAGSVGLGIWALAGADRLRRRRRFWKPGKLLDHPVLWSRHTGPAIVGLVRPRVVVPSWVSEVEPSQQKLILSHEEEHRRAGDGVLRFAMAALLVAFPWNPFLWLHYRHLCLAIELDCDHRVVRRLPDRRWLYGDLLVQVGSRSGPRPGFAPTAFAERRSFLERRIGKLLSEAPEVPMAKVAFFAFAAVLVAGVAMWVPGVTREARQSVDSGPPEVGFRTVGYEFRLKSAWESTFRQRSDGSFGLSYEWGTEVVPFPLEVVDADRPDILAFQVWEGEPDAPLPVVALPAAHSPNLAAYEAPPVPPDASVMKTPQYVYHTTRPELANRWQVKEVLERYYPRFLRDAGISGTAVVYLFVNTDGSVTEEALKTSAGHPSLDWAAVQAAKSARFLPASNEGIPVGIWIEMEMPFDAE